MKKACAIFLTLAMILAVVLVPAPVEAAEAGHIDHSTVTDHCACGGTAKGIGDHTKCTPVTGTWTDLNAKFVGATGTVTLEGGNYYLTADLEIPHQIKVAANATEFNICLNGYTLTGTSMANKVRALYFANGSDTTYSVCDCQGGGKVATANASEGCVLISNKGTVNLYSGTFEGAAGDACSAVRFNETATCNIYNAKIINSGVGYGLGVGKGKVTMYGGSVEKTQPGQGAVYVVDGATFEMLGGSVIGDKITTNTNNPTVKISGGFLQLVEDFATSSNVTIDAANDLVIDLNGKKLSGSVTGKIGLADSSIAAGENIAANVEIEGFGLSNVNQVVESPVGRYITLENEGALSIHRIYVGFDTIQLYKDDNGNVGMNYVTNFKMDDEVKALLTDGANGYAVGCKFGAAAPVGYSKANYKANIATNISAILDEDGNDATDFATAINATTFVNLTVGGQAVTIESNPYEYSLKDVYVAMDKIAKGEVTDKELTGTAKEIYEFIGTEYAEVVATLNG